MTEQYDPNNNAIISPEQIADLFDGTMGRSNSMLDTLTVYSAGKEDYFKRGDEKVNSVVGILLYSKRPMRTFWLSEEISNKPPDCFSIDGFKPSGESKEPQADQCSDCPMDKFGSASKGAGKACKTRAADFMLEVAITDLALMPITPITPIIPTALPVVTLDAKRILGPALIRYGIGNRESADAYASLLRFAKERGTYVQALLCRWGFVKGENKAGVKYDVVRVEPLAKIDDATVQGVIVPMVRLLKGGQAVEVLTALAGRKETDDTGAAG